ncbi:hypothetical protein [Parendozoicomonas haliclonae]|uniref:Uncharacterized protein n=1 Tax=Parendozoicomonas haliclonae TaxID=1960125 RepID=A0A1X7ATL8_9GAMM|nr:hypothetical protein [Parendozoicomonas haliclonae]SMA50757.1 hypothetical protein EHSB41UT_04574 [Parendozoicomonas haliclonae]
MTAYSHQKDAQPQTASITNGYWFYFEVDGHNVAVFCSAISGQETVFVDDEIVSNFRNLLKMDARHTFQIDGVEYKIIIRTEKLLTGQISCTLRKGFQILGEQKKGLVQKFPFKTLFFTLLFLFLAGYGAGNLLFHIVQGFKELYLAGNDFGQTVYHFVQTLKG